MLSAVLGMLSSSSSSCNPETQMHCRQGKRSTQISSNTSSSTSHGLKKEIWYHSAVEAEHFQCLIWVTFESWQCLDIKAVWWVSALISPCGLCLLIDLLDSEVLYSLCWLRWSKQRDLDLQAGEMPADTEPIKLCFPSHSSAFSVSQCLRAALGQARASSPAVQRGLELGWSLYTVASRIRVLSASGQDGGGTDGWWAGWSLFSPCPGARPVPVLPPGPGLCLCFSDGGVAY